MLGRGGKMFEEDRNSKTKNMKAHDKSGDSMVAKSSFCSFLKCDSNLDPRAIIRATICKHYLGTSN